MLSLTALCSRIWCRMSAAGARLVGCDRSCSRGVATGMPPGTSSRVYEKPLEAVLKPQRSVRCGLASSVCVVDRDGVAVRVSGRERPAEGAIDRLSICATALAPPQLCEQHERLPVEPRQLHHGAEKAARGEVEGHDVVLAYAVQATVRSESQSPRPAELQRAVRNEDAE
jgi:hypothetical protein